MKWYKHITDSLDDPDIYDACELFGPAGYLVFFRTLEVMGREFDVQNPGVNTFSVAFLKKKYPLSWRNTSRILQFYHEKKRIFCQYSTNGKLPTITLNCPKLKTLCDEYTEKKLKEISGQTPDKLPIQIGSDSGTDKEVDKEEKKKSTAKRSPEAPVVAGQKSDELKFIITKKRRRMQRQKLMDFMRFWTVFNYKRGRAETADAWLEIVGYSPELVETIIGAAEMEARERPGLEARGDTPKMAQGWISGRRWENWEDALKARASPRQTDDLPPDHEEFAKLAMKSYGEDRR